VKKALIAGGVVVLLALVLFASLRGSRSQKGTEVYAEAAERRGIARVVKATGQVDPRIKVNISAHVVAKISRLYVVEGQDVRAGQPFLELEKESFTAQSDRAAAALEIAQSQRRQAEVELADAELQLARTRKLVSDGIAPQERLEAAELRHRSARLQLEQASEAIRQADAGLVQARDELRKTTLYAPISGRVIALAAKEGEVVVSGTMNNPASIIATVADLSELLVEVEVDETEIVDVQVGQEAKVRVDAIPDHEYHGRVVEIGSSGFSRPQQPDVTLFKVKVLLADPDARLRPGMSARAEIAVATHPEALVVPVQSVVFRRPLDAGGEPREGEEEIKVAFVVSEGKAVQRPVEIGIADATHVEILSGLQPGERVVTGPQRALKDLEPGDAVRIEEKEKEEERSRRDRDRDEEDDDGEDGAEEG
jgi:HlyD family secretion protein